MAQEYGRRCALNNAPRIIKEIIVHCTATPAQMDVSAAEVDRWHRERGSQCIGYHWLVRLDGRVERGRDESVIGAHCRGHNSSSIGVAYAGGIGSDGKPADTRTTAQKIALQQLLAAIKRRYPDSKIFGHRDFAAKACPCFDATTEYSGL